MSARVLFDTHILLWALTGDERLPVKAREMMKDPETAIFYSSVSVWEVAIKHLKNPSRHRGKGGGASARLLAAGKDAHGRCAAADGGDSPLGRMHQIHYTQTV